MKILNDKNFEEEVIKSDTPVMVDFWASWCKPCTIQMPIIQILDNEYKNIKMGKINVEDSPQTVSKYHIMSLPTIMIFNGGKVIKQMIGLQGKNVLEKELKKL